MNGNLIDRLHLLQGLLQEGKAEQAQAFLSELVVQVEKEKAPGVAVASSECISRWLGSFLDAENNRRLSRIHEATDGDITALNQHVEHRRALLELALNAGDLAEEIARTYELLGEPGCEDNSAKGVVKELA